MNKEKLAIVFSGFYFLLFLITLPVGYDYLTWTLFLFSPVVLLYLVYSVIRYGKYSGRELKDGEEWGEV